MVFSDVSSDVPILFECQAAQMAFHQLVLHDGVLSKPLTVVWTGSLPDQSISLMLPGPKMSQEGIVLGMKTSRVLKAICSHIGLPLSIKNPPKSWVTVLPLTGEIQFQFVHVSCIGIKCHLSPQSPWPIAIEGLREGLAMKS